MCGIVSYIGKKSISEVLLVGLTRLEYRGYDSAGIAVLHNDEIQVRKAKGKIKNLEEVLQGHPIEGYMGVGHTRWATHGEANKKNAHPHTDTKRHLALVHNGVIENYYELKNELLELGYIFHSETDTEIIPYLLEENLKKTNDVKKALYHSLQKLKGRYAFVFIHDLEPNKIFFARNGSPLIFGKGKEETFLASDIPAIIPLSKKYYIINNNEWGYITAEGGLSLRNQENKKIDYELKEINIKVSDINKNGYNHYMLKEIYEQPNILRNIIQTRISQNGKVSFPEKKGDNLFLGQLNRIIITSAGTSWHASLIGKMYFEQLAKIPAEVDVSSEFRYRNPILGGDSKVVAISQSGETADTIASIYEAKAKFLRVLSFVNNTNSTIARESDAYIDLMAGQEIGVASTKAYTAQLIHLLLYSIYLAGIRWVMDKEKRKKLYSEIIQLPNQMEKILNKAEIIKTWSKDFKKTKDFIFLGRSWDQPTALEGALKLKETSYIHASGYAGGEFKHGPIALITEEVPVVCLATKSETYEKMLSNMEEVKARKGKIIAIHTEGDPNISDLADYSFAIPKCTSVLSPILNVIPLQLLAYYIALEKGCEPDQPRNLAKSVTVE